MAGSVASSSVMPKTCPISRAVMERNSGASGWPNAPTAPGLLKSKPRSTAPSGSMKSCILLFFPACFSSPGLISRIPEKPVTTASPALRSGCVAVVSCARAKFCPGIKNEQTVTKSAKTSFARNHSVRCLLSATAPPWPNDIMNPFLCSLFNCHLY